MTSFVHRIRQPVKREHAEQYLLLTLVSFAATVLLTRGYLHVTGYPQIGDATFHIAHVLWGGLLLFIAALLPLLLANRAVYTLGALLSGIGVGLFIDEVGKFITRSNDYFFPAAAPIIYVVFLLTVLLYLQVRRPSTRAPRAELYRALDSLGELLDGDLEPHERAQLIRRLRSIAHQPTRTAQPALAQLARALLDFLDHDTVPVVDGAPRFVRRWRRRLRLFGRRWIGRRSLKLILVIGLLVLGLPAIVTIGLLLAAIGGPLELQVEIAAALVPFHSSVIGLFDLALSAGASLLLLIAAVLLLFGRDRRGILLSYSGLLLSLLLGNVITFYVEQFQAIISVIIQFSLLLTTLYYRRRFLANDEPADPVD